MRRLRPSSGFYENLWDSSVWGYKIFLARKYPQMLRIQEIKNAKVSDKPRKLYDRDGRYLFVTPAGGKLWRVRIQVGERSGAGIHPLRT